MSNADIDELTILPCHSIWKGGKSKGLDRDEWHLAPFQYEGLDQLSFREHILQCIEILKMNPHTLLIISGGQTKKEAGPISEAESYYALFKGLLDENLLKEEVTRLLSRTFLEEFARDSFENVLYLLCRFYEEVHKYPRRITVVGFEFKRKRFVNHHLAEAIKFPRDRVRYIGNAPRPGPETDQNRYFEQLIKEEEKHALSHFRRDFYGIQHPLSVKKESRNPFGQRHRYAESNPELAKFFKILTQQDPPASTEEIKNELIIQW